MKKLFFLLGCLLVLSSKSAWAQTAVPEIAVVRIFDANSRVELEIVRGVENPEFREAKSKEASKLYQQVIKNLYQQGYVLQGIVPGSQSPVGGTSTLIFVKPAKP